jgi:hypothetical protein
MLQNRSLSSRRQTSREPWREVGSKNFFLGYAQVVGHAMEADNPCVAVEHGEGGSPVSISRLPNRAGIDEIPKLFAKRPVRRLGLSDRAVSRTIGFTDFSLQGESTLQVGMSEKSDGNGIGDERLNRVTNADHVLVFIERRTMHELDTREFVDLNGTLRQSAKPFKIGRGKLVTRPKRGETRDGIEVFQIHQSADGLVVIAPNEDFADGLGANDHLVGIAAVANRVSQIHDEVVRRSGFEAGVERFKIAVNVAKEKDTHAK